MAEMYSYNGYILPKKPYSWAVGCDVIYIKDGTFHYLNGDWIGIHLFGIHPDENVLHHRISVTHWILEDDKWIKSSEKIERNTPICPKENLIWCTDDINYQPYDIWTTGQVRDLYMAGSEAILVTDYPMLPIINAYGWNKSEDFTSNPPKVANCQIAHISIPQERLWRSTIWNTCSASINDGGTIAMEWYKNNELHDVIIEDDGVILSQFQPSVREIANSTWFVVVTNIKDGYKRVKILKDFTINVIDWNLERNENMNASSNQKIEEGCYERISSYEIIKEGLQDFSLISNSFSKNNQEQVILFLNENGNLYPLTTLLKVKGLRGD